MTAKTKTSLINLAAVIGAIGGVSAITAPLTRAAARDAVVAHGESVFVRRDSFALYLERQKTARFIDSVERQMVRADLDTVKRMMRDRR